MDVKHLSREELQEIRGRCSTWSSNVDDVRAKIPHYIWKRKQRNSLQEEGRLVDKMDKMKISSDARADASAVRAEVPMRARASSMHAPSRPVAPAIPIPTITENDVRAGEVPVYIWRRQSESSGSAPMMPAPHVPMPAPHVQMPAPVSAPMPAPVTIVKKSGTKAPPSSPAPIYDQGQLLDMIALGLMHLENFPVVMTPAATVGKKARLTLKCKQLGNNTAVSSAI